MTLTAPRRRPRHWSLLTVAAAALVAMPAAAAEPEPVPPAGTVIVAVLQSDGLALLPVGVATIPPLACKP